MALDYSNMGQSAPGMDDDIAMLSNILGDVTAKITVTTEEIPSDYSGVSRKKTTEEEADVAVMLPGPALMMLANGMAPPMMQPPMQQPMMNDPMQPQQMNPAALGMGM